MKTQLEVGNFATLLKPEKVSKFELLYGHQPNHTPHENIGKALRHQGLICMGQLVISLRTRPNASYFQNKKKIPPGQAQLKLSLSTMPRYLIHPTV
jgi:hypothetical protein